MWASPLRGEVGGGYVRWNSGCYAKDAENEGT